MTLKNLLINKNALRRITRIYLPVILGFYLLLTALGFYTDRAPETLNLAQDFTGRKPVVYSPAYNVEFFGLEKLHPFDSTKYRHIIEGLEAAGALKDSDIIAAAPPDAGLLHLAESDEYLASLQHSWTMARVMELPFLRIFPDRLTRNLLLAPMLYQTGGSLLAAKAALKFGWAVNLGGGFHHASFDGGQGFCPLADISLIVKYLRREKLAQKIMIIDLDAHQGNGHETDFRGDEDVYILDAYNGEVYPHDEEAKKAIRIKLELPAFTNDASYFPPLHNALQRAFQEFKPDLVIYNAGTDLLTGDPLGALDISADGVVKRDEMVTEAAREAKVPLVMLLSGGYQKSNAAVITRSLLNLRAKFSAF